MLFEFISGLSGLVGFDFPQYVEIVARVHSADIPAMRDLPLEDFRLQFNGPLLAAMQPPWQTEGNTETRMELRRFLGRYRTQIDDYWEELQTLAFSCRAASWTPAITHSDAIDHNLLVDDAGKVYITDWDEMMLGPRERDTWFWLYGEKAADFLRVYRQQFPDYQPDPTLCRFYLLRRFFEDVGSFIEEIEKRPELVEQLRLFTGMSDSWFAWLWIPMQRTGPATS